MNQEIKRISGRFQSIIPPAFQDRPWYHFSVDDVFDSLIDVTRQGTPLFEHPFFALMKEVHDTYDAAIDLELFWERDIDNVLYTLRDVRDLREEIRKEGSWLRFGPHAQSYMVAPHEQFPHEQQRIFDDIYEQVERFAGKEFFAPWVRLHFYAESYELADYFKNKGVTALFSTDREAGSHRMLPENAKELLTDGFTTHEGMNFIRTQFRLEFFTNNRNTDEDLRRIFKEALAQYGHITFYSHEYEFARAEVRNMIRRVFEVLKSLKVESIRFPLT